MADYDKLLEMLNRELDFYGVKNRDDEYNMQLLETAVQYILIWCNISALPSALYSEAVKIACGKFLYYLKCTGQLDISNTDLKTAAVKSIAEGKTTVTFATGSEGSQTDEQRINALIISLMTPDEGVLACYRHIKW